jgi:Fe-coproporphyrin III synthase
MISSSIGATAPARTRAPARLPARLKNLGRMMRGVLSDVPQALRREYDYVTGTRRSAILTLTWRCTSHCSSCMAWRRPAQPQRELTAHQWLDTAAALVGRGIRSVELFGGDVLLRKDALLPLCELLHAAGCKVYIPTNCNLLDDTTAAIFARTVYALFLSTDALAEAHDMIRGTPGTFSRMTQARQKLLEARGGGGRPRIICNTTVSRHNVDQLAQLAAFACRAGYDQIDLEYVGQFDSQHVAGSCINGAPPAPIYLQQDQSCLITPQQVPLLRRQLAAARALRGRPTTAGKPFEVVTINIDMLTDQNLVAGTVPHRRCFMERATTIIDPYGNIVPCLFFDNFSVGNVLDGSLEQSWETPRRSAFREHRQEGKLVLCRHCIMSVIRNRTGVDVIRRAVVAARQD